MEQNSQTNEATEARNILKGQLRECFGRVVYSHKTHEKCSDILLKRLSTIKLSQIILSAFTTGSFISTFFSADNIGAGIGLFLSNVLLALNAYTKDYDLGELAQKHKQAAIDIWLIRERYLSLLVDLGQKDVSIEQLKAKRDTLLENLHTVYVGSPSTTFKAYRKAQSALQTKEDMTFSDDEIDAFLPSELKRS